VRRFIGKNRPAQISTTILPTTLNITAQYFCLVKSPLHDTYPVKGHSPISSTSQLLYKVTATMVSITHEYRVPYTSLFIFVSGSHINIQHWSAAGTGYNFAFQSNNKWSDMSMDKSLTQHMKMVQKPPSRAF